MNELLPIIRRKRRPLLPVESLHDLPTVVAENAQHSTFNIQLPVKGLMEDGKKSNDSLPRRLKGNEKTSITR